MHRLPRLPNPPLPRPFAFVLFFIWWGTLFALSSMSPPELPSLAFSTNDKVAHALYFFAGAFLFASAIRSPTGSGLDSSRTWLAVAALAAIGAGDELFQKFTPGRTGADPLDWLADCAGAIAGAWFAKWIFTPVPLQNSAGKS